MMKHITLTFFLFLFILSCGSSKPTVLHNGSTYSVDKNSVYQDGENVSASLSDEDRQAIISKHQRELQVQKEIDAREDALQKAQRAEDKAEKARRKAEKELKQKERAQDRFDEATEDLAKAQKRYERLKRKGKLSPNEEVDWLEKIEKLREDLKKAKRKL